MTHNTDPRDVEREAFEAHLQTATWHQVMVLAKDDDDDGASVYRMCRLAAREAWKAGRAALSEQAQPEQITLRDRLQKQCSDWGTYWRASDAHGVELTKPQAIELLENALGVEVEIKDNGCVSCDGTGKIGDQPCPDCADTAQSEQDIRLNPIFTQGYDAGMKDGKALASSDHYKPEPSDAYKVCSECRKPLGSQECTHWVRLPEPMSAEARAQLIALTTPPAPPEPSEYGAVMKHRLMRKVNGDWVAASEMMTGLPDESWVRKVHELPDEWRIDYVRRWTGAQIASGIAKALATPPAPTPVETGGEAKSIEDQATFIAREFGAPLDSQETKDAHVAAIVALASPAAQAQERKPPFHFRRFVNGVEMAEDIQIEREATLEDAIKAAVRICPPSNCTVLVCEAGTVAAAPAQEPTEAMVTAYLEANDRYWRETDAMPHKNPSKWRNGTPSEATRVSLRAALAAAPAPARKPLTDEQIGEATKHIRGIHCSIVDDIARAIEAAHGITAEDRNHHG